MDSAIRKADRTRAPSRRAAPDSFRPQANSLESWVEGPLVSFSEIEHADGAPCEPRTLRSATSIECRVDGKPGGPEAETVAAASTRQRARVFFSPSPTRRSDGRKQSGRAERADPRVRAWASAPHPSSRHLPLRKARHDNRTLKAVG